MKVSAVIITYNHESSLPTAVDSALMQAADFDFEVVVAEDCSTDGTRRVAQDLARRNPDKVIALCRDKNLGANGNFMEALKHCRGEYVALLEGDDRWTHPRKLQRQAGFLDMHRDCSMCCHAVNYVHDDGSEPPRRFPEGGKSQSSLEDILDGANFHTCSFMFRRALLPSPPDWLRTLWIGDWPVLMLLAEKGDVGFIDEVMAEYRIHPAGVWSSSSSARRIEGLLDVYRHTRQHLAARCSAQTAWLVARQACHLSHERELVGRRDEARQLVLEAINVLMEESPPDERLSDALVKIVFHLVTQMPGKMSLESANLVAEVKRLHTEVAARDNQIASISGEIARLKASRFWRARQLLFAIPGLRRLIPALGNLFSRPARQPVKYR